MTRKDYEQIVDQIPKDPGVYKFLDNDNQILYVGKAKQLKKRIASYFNAQANNYNKTKVLVKHAVRIEYIIVDSEEDALLLENTLIKKYKPRYNVNLKDGKSYSYLCIRNEAYPRVYFTRKIVQDGSTYFGPYTSRWRMMQIMEIVRILFPLRTCTLNLSEKAIQNNKYKVCLEYHIKNCMGPCENLESRAQYDAKISQIKNILKGNFGPVKDYIKLQMQLHAERLEFEKAQMYKEKLDLFEDYQSKSTVVSTTISDVDVFSMVGDEEFAYVNYLKVVKGALINTYILEMKKNLTEDKETLLTYAILHLREKFNSISKEIILPFKLNLSEYNIKVTVPRISDKLKLLELSEKNATYHLKQKILEQNTSTTKLNPAERILKTLQADLQMSRLPVHIECFDNSNLQGAYPVASCVVFKNAKPANRDYRHFHIKTVIGANDFASMEEIVYRRYKRLLDNNEELPQLVIIDGGKGQLSAAVKSLTQLDLMSKITVIGIAKKLEEIYFPGDSIPIHINKKSESLKLIQQARNEAHRFAISFHRNIRSKYSGKTALENIKGIGSETAKKLLIKYESIAALKEAGYESWKDYLGLKIADKLKIYFDEIS
jgi:excinuclease ABC subunit C